MFQYETIMDLADLKYVSFVCKNEPCGGALSIINMDAVTTVDGVPSSIKPVCPKCRQEIPGAEEFIRAFRTLRSMAVVEDSGIRLRIGPASAESIGWSR